MPRHFPRRLVASYLAASALVVSSLAAQTSLSVGSARTDLGNSAIRLSITSSADLGEIAGITPRVSSSGTTAWGYYFTPRVRVLTGDADAMEGIALAVSGVFLPHLRITGTDIERDQNFWVLPVSVGVESNGTFDWVNTLGEVGVTRIFRTGPLSEIPFRFGVYGQAGYKAQVSDDTSAAAGGAADESAEALDEMLGRFKGELSIDLPLFRFAEEGPRTQVMFHPTYWYDLVNSESYYRIEGVLRIPLGEDGKQNLDIIYEKGSGAPNFNQGEQFSANLTIVF